MNDKEKALINYINFLREIHNLNLKVLDKFFEIKYMYAKDRYDVFKEKDEINKLLMVNYFLMSQFEILYTIFFNEDIDYLEKFIKKHSLNHDLFKESLKDLKNIYIYFKDNYGEKLSKGHKDKIENSPEEIHKEIKSHYYLTNESWKLSILISNKFEDLDLYYKTGLFSSNPLMSMAKSLTSRFPLNTLFSSVAEELRYLNDRIIDELEDKGCFKE